MTRKGSSPEKTDVTPDDLRRVAALIRRYSSQYEAVAEEMELAELASIPATGFKALENNSLKLIRGHAGKLKATVQSLADAKVLASLADTKGKYALDDGASQKKRAQKGQPKHDGP